MTRNQRLMRSLPNYLRQSVQDLRAAVRVARRKRESGDLRQHQLDAFLDLAMEVLAGKPTILTEDLNAEAYETPAHRKAKGPPVGVG